MAAPAEMTRSASPKMCGVGIEPRSANCLPGEGGCAAPGVGRVGHAAQSCGGSRNDGYDEEFELQIEERHVDATAGVPNDLTHRERRRHFKELACSRCRRRLILPEVY